LVASSEAKHHLPHHLLSAVIEVESGGRIHRISPAGAMGPGQLSPATAQLLKVEDPFDPQQNLEASARYLAAQVATFHDVRLALAAYNAGPGAIVNRTIPHNGETEFYVQKVMRAYAARL
jgi:soluble lytic murein transglycosylase-like protein